jgi:hypothetical protein
MRVSVEWDRPSVAQPLRGKKMAIDTFNRIDQEYPLDRSIDNP